MALYATVALLAATRTSLVFDEITLMSGGARGFATGRFDLVPDHPPLLQYAYGAAVLLAGVSPPIDPGDVLEPGFRYEYSRRLVSGPGSDPRRSALNARLVSVLCGALLIVVVFGYARSRMGPAVALLAASLAAFLPDILAYGGVAYNDLPLALLYVGGGWAAERMVRTPGIRAGALVGVLFAAALGVKFSGVVLLLVLLGQVGMEMRARFPDRQWRIGLVRALAAASASAYLVSVAIYRGDPTLAALRTGLLQQIALVSTGHEIAVAYLWGETSTTGWWYFFPAAFLLKTPAAFHSLVVLALVGLLRPGSGGDERALPRAVPLGILAYLVVLLPSRLAIGFRHAMPLLPWLCILVAGGVARLWQKHGPLLRGTVAALVLWHSVGTLSWYPHFLAYTSEYVGARDDGHRALLDSSLDWGQGLVELSAYLRRNGIDRVFLGYFGSVFPEAYGIAYEPLPSFLELRGARVAPGPLPSHAVVSATLLHGLFVEGDPFAVIRQERPVAILGHTLFVYRVAADAATGAISVLPDDAARADGR